MIILHRNNGMALRAWLARIKRLPRLTRWPLGVEIALALVLKLALLALIWNAFFSTPQAKKMRMPTPQVEQHLLTPAQPPTLAGTRPESPSSAEAAHDSNR
jgi:hypothetical protein